MRILVMGLPGSGKTTLATVLAEKLNAAYFNADEVRKMFNDWDFTEEGRVRQADRMYRLSVQAETEYTVSDFVCPTAETLESFEPDFLVFMDTIPAGRFEDTNRIFQSPARADWTVSEWGDVQTQADEIIAQMLIPRPAFDWKKPTGLMIGRFQPFHDGHLKLFETILEKEGQVLICIRDTHNTDEKNPFGFWEVYERINEVLDNKYSGRFNIIQVPNITGVYYGRDVGYKVEQLHLGADVESISATNIRKSMGL